MYLHVYMQSQGADNHLRTSEQRTPLEPDALPGLRLTVNSGGCLSSTPSFEEVLHQDVSSLGRESWCACLIPQHVPWHRWALGVWGEGLH